MKRHIPAAERPSSIKRSSEDRPARIPINGARDIMTVRGMEPGYHYCWVNEDRVDRYLDAAYEFVTHDVSVGDRKINAASQIGGKVSKKVGVNEDGSPMTGYLMRIDEQLYLEDVKAHDEDVNEREQALQVNIGRAPNESGQYGKVQIGRGKEPATSY